MKPPLTGQNAALEKKLQHYVTSIKRDCIAELRKAAVEVGPMPGIEDHEKIHGLEWLGRTNYSLSKEHPPLRTKTILEGLAEGKGQPIERTPNKRNSKDHESGKAAPQAAEPEWRERKVTGKPMPSMHNARLAIAALGVTCSFDTFHNKVLFGYRDETFKHHLQSIVGEVSDHGVMALRQLASDRFGFDLKAEHMRDAVQSLALENCFNPVRDLIDKAEAEWDGVNRLDRMAVDYFNCEDTSLNRACIRKTMIALVARARVPGIKFDTITVLESPEGFNKSTAWRVLAGDENFSDEAIIGKDSREVQEQLAGVWIHESADLAGMKKSEVETVKTYASRQTDRARPAFGHYLVDQPRHSIEVGTTNNDEYLQSQTGNRRFWPLTVTKPIDIEKLRRNRLQLIGEAARYQSAGESIVLDEALWPAAAVEQEQRRVKDPWEAVLATMPESIENEEYRDGLLRKKTIQIIHKADDRQIVASADLLTHVLKILPAQQTPQSAMRLSTVMSKLGWQRPKNRLLTINGNRTPGYFRQVKAVTGAPETPGSASLLCVESAGGR